MNENEIRTALDGLRLGGLRYFKTIGSTNDVALSWARENAEDRSLVVAEEQTAGRGRSGRKWFTPPGSALALSLILRPVEAERKYPSRVTGLAALALIDVLTNLGCDAQIKWPNDVVIKGRKVAGILVESVWTGSNLDTLILGLGVNVSVNSVPPASELFFPASSIEAEVGYLPNRLDLLREVVSALMVWRNKLPSDQFIKSWESCLAFRDQQVEIHHQAGLSLIGRLSGLDADGSLRLTVGGKPVAVQFGEIHLRLAP